MSINRENQALCLVFAMGMEAAPFLHRVEVRRRWKTGRATYREVFFEGQTILVVRCGIGPRKAAAAIRDLGRMPSAILSVGTAGSLEPGLRLGDVIIASQTVSESEPDAVAEWPASLVKAVENACLAENVPCRVDRLVTAGNAVFARPAREKLRWLTGAVAVDMESHAIGLEARRLGIPFTCVRAISDDIEAPPLPDLKSFRQVLSQPRRWPEGISSMLRWRFFLADFRRAVRLLPGPLVRFIRNATW